MPPNQASPMTRIYPASYLQGLAYLQLHDAAHALSAFQSAVRANSGTLQQGYCSFSRAGLPGVGARVRHGRRQAKREESIRSGVRDLERRGRGLANVGGGKEGIRRALDQKGEVLLRRTIFIPLIVLTLLFTGCKSTYYKTMRTLGKEKRDILVSAHQRCQEGSGSNQEATANDHGVFPGAHRL